MYRDQFLTYENSSHNVEDLWNLFKQNLNQATIKFVPHKLMTRKNNLPWITPNIKRMLRKRDKIHKKNQNGTFHCH
jgi:hypothetical protein